MNQEENQYFNQMMGDLEEEQQKNRELTKAHNSQMNLFNSEQEENLIRWQLDLREDLDRIYHLLKGDILNITEDGEQNYLPSSNPNLRPFNEFGVQMIMNVMQFYLNRNTILSNYDEDTILWKVHDFGVELSDLIFNKYEEMMVTIESDDHEVIKEHIAEKIKLYPMIIKELVDTVHSAYLRAFHGGERESLRTARTVTQSEPLYRGSPQGMNMQLGQKKFKWYNPGTWGG
jgi:hypothetical protein